VYNTGFTEEQPTNILVTIARTQSEQKTGFVPCKHVSCPFLQTQSIYLSS